MKNYLLFLFFFLKLPLEAQFGFNWAKEMTSAGIQMGQSNSIAVDENGNVFTTGYFYGTIDFDPGPGIFNLSTPTGNGGNQVFISKLDSSGNFMWAKQFTGSNYSFALSIANDANGNVYTTGYFGNTVDFDPGPGIFNITSVGSEDVFICKLNSAGNFVWAKRIGGPNQERAFSLTIDKNGNVYTTGYFNDVCDFDPSPNVFNLSSPSNDIFVSKLDSLGNFIWAKNKTGGGMSWDITTDAFGNIYTTGQSGGNAVVSKLDPAGTFIWDRNIGGPNTFGYSIDADINGDVYTTGIFEDSTDFDPGVGIYKLHSNGSADIFVNKLSAAGNFIFAKSIGGAGYDQGYSIVCQLNGDVYTTGYFQDTADFDPGVGIYKLSSNGSADIFVAQLNSVGDFICAGRMGGKGVDYCTSIALSISDNIYTTGLFGDTADFDPGVNVYNLNHPSIFVSKLNNCGLFSSVLEIEAEFGYTIYPNPSSGIFIVNLKSKTVDANVRVYDVLGNCIWNKDCRDKVELKIDLSCRPRGIYFMEILSEGHRAIQKIVVE